MNNVGTRRRRGEQTDAGERAVAREIISRYPRPKSALIPLLHLSQGRTAT
ncbi:MAG: hypothetical protein R2749_02330 [Acidimicrobiales bacterium]